MKKSSTLYFFFLLIFELVNFYLVRTALGDLLGSLSLLGVSWSLILAIAFCFIDTVGIAHYLNDEKKLSQLGEIWYLRIAWSLAAIMAGMLHWWALCLLLWPINPFLAGLIAFLTLSVRVVLVDIIPNRFSR